MSIIFFLLYNAFFIPFLIVVVRIGGLFNPKIKRGLKGRCGLFATLQQDLAKARPSSLHVWMHIASMGELEQAKPVILNLKSRFPHALVILSVFSPSVIKNAKAFHDADIVCYIPLDSYWQAKKFIGLIAPNLALIVRHDIWPNHLWRLRKMKIPTVLLDASISDKRSGTFVLFRPFYRTLYAHFSEIMAVSWENAARVQKVYPFADRLHVCGDTRYDQVFRRTKEAGKIDHLLSAGYFQRERTFVVGSTWPSDEKCLFPAIAGALQKFPDLKVIVAPHEPTDAHVADMASFFQEQNICFRRYTQLDASANGLFRVLIIDRLGLLANLYGLGQLAFVGGGFGPGVHNILEPAAHGCAVLFGPRHRNSVEAMQLAKRGGAKAIHSTSEATAELMAYLQQPEGVRQVGGIALQMVQENLGASERCVDILQKYLTNGTQGQSNG